MIDNAFLEASINYIGDDTKRMTWGNFNYII